MIAVRLICANCDANRVLTVMMFFFNPLKKKKIGLSKKVQSSTCGLSVCRLHAVRGFSSDTSISPNIKTCCSLWLVTPGCPLAAAVESSCP